MIHIKDLHASVETEQGNIKIIKGLDLDINKGEIHAIMGPNGSGKSTLASVLAGKEGYEVTSGVAKFDDKNIFEMEPEERANEGMFLAFQYPIEVPGVSNANFLKEAVAEKREYLGLEPMSSRDFLQHMRDKAKLVKLDPSFISRSVNEGFSGGEKKRNEIFQMAVLEPKFGILDETDSGLDIDALKIVADGVNEIHNDDNAFLVITHYQRLLNYIEPDFVHVLMDGKIVKSGGKELALKLEEEGYDWIKEELQMA